MVLVHHKTKNCHVSLPVAQQGSARMGLEERPAGRQAAICKIKTILETQGTAVTSGLLL